jgi:hypothetical protein
MLHRAGQLRKGGAAMSLARGNGRAWQRRVRVVGLNLLLALRGTEIQAKPSVTELAASLGQDSP